MFIYGIILVVMYVLIIQGNIVEGVSEFNDRKENTSIKLGDIDTDYTSEKASRVYLQYFLDNLSKVNENQLKSFFDYSYYNTYSSSIKSTLSQKARIKDTKNNTSYLELVSSKTNESGDKVLVYNVIVMKKNYMYPEGYKILSEENSVDKNKNIDIWVIEKAPYEFVLQIPDKEFVG